MTGIERLAAEGIAALFLIWGTVLYLEHRGAQVCLKADATAVQAQETANAIKAATDAQTINQEAIDHAKALAAAPDPTPALVCVRKYATPRALSAPEVAQPVSHGAPDGAKADQSPVGDDPGPDLAKIGQAADAQI